MKGRSKNSLIAPNLSTTTIELREASLLPCGSADGLFTVLYAFENEGVGEISNATVHAFSAMALERVESGYRLYWAIYVAPVSRLTPVYMAAIDPFRRFLVYPSILRRLHEGWIKKFPTDSAHRPLVP